MAGKGEKKPQVRGPLLGWRPWPVRWWPEARPRQGPPSLALIEQRRASRKRKQQRRAGK